MKVFSSTVYLACVLGVCAVSMAFAAGRPKVGVALGGGAAKGLAHIGVLKVLEETGMPIDCLAGVSMGSVVGGMYAIGFTAADLESLVVRVDWAELFSDRTGRRTVHMERKPQDSRSIISFPMEGLRPRMPSGLTGGENVVRLFSQLSLPRQRSEDFRDFPIVFACVATDIMTGEAVVLDKGFLAEAIRASMAIPTVFSPVRIDGRLLVDGGLARLLPAEDVRRLGADIVIGVDVGKREYTEEELNSFLTISNQTLNLMLDKELEKQHRVCDILIRPDMEGVALADFRNAKRIIRRGEEAALAILPRVQALADSLNGLSPGRSAGESARGPAPMDSVYLSDISIGGLSRVPRGVIEKEISIRRPGRVAVREIGEAIERIRGTEHFDRVNSRIEMKGRNARLVLDLHERKRNQLGIGVRYDTRRDAALLLTAALRNVGLGGATLDVAAILREEFDVGAKYLFPIGFVRSFGVKARANVSRVFVNLFEGDQRVAAYRTGYYFGEIGLGTFFSTRMAVSGGMRGEYVDEDLRAGPAGLTDRRDTLFPYYALITVDTFDRTVYPRRGIFAQGSAEAASAEFGSDVSFSRFCFDWRAVVPLGPRVSALQGLYLGKTSGDDLPPAYHFFLGGVDEKITLLGKEGSFFGLEHQERTGRHIQTVQLGVQWEAAKEIYLTLAWNAGNTFEEWPDDLKGNRYINGGGVTLGADTLVGPIELTLMTSEKRDFLAYFTAGYKF